MKKRQWYIRLPFESLLLAAGSDALYIINIMGGDKVKDSLISLIRLKGNYFKVSSHNFLDILLCLQGCVNTCTVSSNEIIIREIVRASYAICQCHTWHGILRRPSFLIPIFMQRTCTYICFLNDIQMTLKVLAAFETGSQ